MPKEYICDLCNKIFTQKSDYDKHKKKKSPCISLTELKKITEKQTITNNIENELSTILKNCLNIMRNEGLTGEKALRNLSYFLILKLLEPQFSNNVIKINDYDYDFDDDEEKEILFKLVFFSNLNEEKEDNIKTNLKVLWEKILSVHPSTNKIFKPDKSFDIEQQANYKNIIKELSKIDLSNIDFDVLGNAYENVIKDIMTGKVLGQFFTPSPVKKLMIDLIDPKLSDDGNIESCCDPTMGTGGFLIEYIRTIQKQAKTKNIKLDWENNIKKKIYGKEIESDTYQLAVSNMLISTGYMFNKLKEDDSIRNPITKKFSSVLANPPYGIKGLKYDDITENRDEHFPIKTDNAVSLFIQTIINMLKINGKCAVVLPDGQDLFSKSKNYALIREYLMKTCDLKKIIYLPAGIFEHTSIKTCVFFFIKKKEGTDILKTDIKVSKTQKEISRTYKFSKTHQTTSVKFCEYNQITTEQHLLVDVPIDKIANNSYSLNYAEYMKDETVEIEYDEGIVVKTLGELFKLNGNGKTNSKDITNTGEYPFYKASCNNPSGTHNTFDFDGKEYLLIIKSGGSSSKPISENYGIGKVFVVNGKCAANIAVFQLLSKTNDNFKYLSYYLKSIQNKIQGLAKYCTNNGNIDMKELMDIKIPIPSLERQQEIVEYCEYNDKLIKQLEKEIENNKNQAKLFINSIGKKHTGRSLVQNTTVNDSNEESDHNTTEDHLLDTDVENPIIEQNIYHEEITEVDELITKESDEDSD